MHALALIAALVSAQWSMSETPSASPVYPVPVTFTGNNSGGTGTVRIRPSDEDTQLALCDQSNNSSPEVCSLFSFSNFSVNEQYELHATNAYYNTSTSKTRVNTSMTAPYTVHRGGNANAGSGVYTGTISIAGVDTGLWGCSLDSGGTTATCTVYSGNTLDVRGPITNTGAATCQGLGSGGVCFDDTIVNMVSATTSSLNLGFGTNSSYAQVVFYNEADAALGGYGSAGSAYSDADLAGQLYFTSSIPYAHNRTDNVAAGSFHTKWRDNTAATGVELMTLDGAGNLFLNASATRSKGTITLVAGTGTATVSSGCVPACVDTTANASVRCSVTTTTLTATGTGTDVIAYHCF